MIPHLNQYTSPEQEIPLHSTASAMPTLRTEGHSDNKSTLAITYRQGRHDCIALCGVSTVLVNTRTKKVKETVRRIEFWGIPQECLITSTVLKLKGHAIPEASALVELPLFCSINRKKLVDKIDKDFHDGKLTNKQKNELYFELFRDQLLHRDLFR